MKASDLSPEEKRENFNAYQRCYRAKNKDRVRQYNNNYAIRKAARLLAEYESKRIGV